MWKTASIWAEDISMGNTSPNLEKYFPLEKSQSFTRFPLLRVTSQQRCGVRGTLCLRLEGWMGLSSNKSKHTHWPRTVGISTRNYPKPLAAHRLWSTRAWSTILEATNVLTLWHGVASAPRLTSGGSWQTWHITTSKDIIREKHLRWRIKLCILDHVMWIARLF